MKRSKLLYLILALAVIFAALMPLGIISFADTEGDATVGEDGRLAVGEGAHLLDGKKILITGCSYTYYGGLVERTGTNVPSQSTRTTGETGLFKRLCNLNGAKDVTVTDWVYGGHDLTDLFDGCCDAADDACDGRDHLADLTDRNYDIVILQDIITPGYTTPEKYVENVRISMEPFLEANPETSFYLFVHHRYYQQANYKSLMQSVEMIKEELGVKIIDWGSLIYDIIEGNATVEGATVDYDYYSFVVSNSKSDGYHPNLLSGYLATVITYATLTGETAIGQPYEFIYGLTSKYLNIDKYISSYYKYDDPSTEKDERATNMKTIFYSASDMLGLQKLADEYLSKERWLDIAQYTVEFKAEGEVISADSYKWGERIAEPTAPEKAGDSTWRYVFSGWDKTVTDCRGNATYTAVYEKSYIDYAVKFLDYDGKTVISEDTYHYGDSVTPPVLSDREDEEYRYVFSGWDKEVTPCVGDATYTAVYTPMTKGYAVIFRDYDGTLISALSCKLGDAVTAPDTPTRVSDNTYNYVFSGWDKEVTPCVGDTTYTATYTASFIDYTVRFVDFSGGLISEEIYHYGDEVRVPETPTRAADNVYTYTFDGWDGTVTECLGDTTYTATYRQDYILYNVTFFDERGEVIQSMSRHWGATITAPEAPPKPSDGEYTYTFIGWDKEVVDCAGDTSYTAVYRADPIEPDAPETPDAPEMPEGSETPDEEHVCEGVNGWDRFWRAIFNFFRRMFGMKPLCTCGKTTLD